MLSVNDETFQQEVLDHDGPVLVKFSSESCGPCKMMGTIYESFLEDEKEWIEDNPDEALLTKFKAVNIDVTVAVETSPQYAIKSIPTHLVIHKGKVVGLPKIGMMQGGQFKDALEVWLSKIEDQEAEEEDEEVVDLSDQEL